MVKLPDKVEMTDGGAFIETRERLIDSIEKYLAKGGSSYFRLLAGMDVNFTFDDILKGDMVQVGPYKFKFTRDRYVPLGNYFIMQRG